MQREKILKTQMFCFFIIVITLFSCLVFYVKMGTILIPKIDKKIDKFIEENYKDIKDEVNFGKTKYDQINTTFVRKVTNKDNKELYFFITYKHKKITSSYKKDYVEGKSLLTKYKNELEKDLNNSKKYNSVDITFTKKLNEYTTNVQEKIIDGDYKDLPIYNIYVELEMDDTNSKIISKKIIDFYKYVIDKGYNPKYYEITISNSKDVDKSFKISNITNDVIVNNLEEIINAILLNDKTIVTKYDIKYQYMN